MLKVGGRDVVATGTVGTSRGDEIIQLSIEDLDIEFIFLSVPDGETSGVFEVQANTLKMRLVNFNNPLGTSFTQQVGVFKGRQLFLTVFVHQVGEKLETKLLSYTVSLGEVIDGK